MNTELKQKSVKFVCLNEKTRIRNKYKGKNKWNCKLSIETKEV